MTSRRWRAYLVAAITLAALVGIWLLDPIPQDPAYHAFADTRTFLGIPNFGNVVSNLPFLVVGAWGLGYVLQDGHGATRALRPAWLSFFGGVALTAAGSAYYHLVPGNASLAWDRLAMTIGFMSLVAIVVGEYLSAPLARRMLPSLILAGAASVAYWSYSEASGAGDLRPYVIVQFLPMLLMPLIIVLYSGRSDMTRGFCWLILFYAAAKAGEFLDSEILEITRVISGHSLKHMLAALGPAALLFLLMRRSSG